MLEKKIIKLELLLRQIVLKKIKQITIFYDDDDSIKTSYHDDDDNIKISNDDGNIKISYDDDYYKINGLDKND